MTNTVKLQVALLLLIAATQSFAQPPNASFTTPDTVCVGAPVPITNTSTGASSFYWSFCPPNLKTAVPEAQNLGNISGNFSNPTFQDYAYYNGNYYGFLLNHIPGALLRLDFGNSLLNTPTSVNLGDLGGIVPSANGSEGLQLVNENGNWYAIVVGGNNAVGTVPRILTISFGSNLANPTPTATNWGNLGNLDQPIDLHLFKEGTIWHGFTVNAENNTITRFDFNAGIANAPTGINLGDIGGMKYPTGIYAYNDNGFWRVFITNAGDDLDQSIPSSIIRLDFGNSLLNIPTAQNLGDLGGIIRHPRDMSIISTCSEIVGYVVNHTGDLVRVDFNQNITSVPTPFSFGTLGGFTYPHSISRLFRINGDVYGFMFSNHILTRLKFSGCTDAAIPSYTGANPGTVSYNKPGKYNITLVVNDGLTSQTSFCREVVVLGKPVISTTPDTTVCANAGFRIKASGGTTYNWTPQSGLSDPAIASPFVAVKSDTRYKVLVANSHCTNTDSVDITVRPYPAFSLSSKQDICKGSTATISASGGDSYNWTSSGSIQSYSNEKIIVNPTATATYTVAIHENTCGHDTTISTILNVHGQPILEVSKSNDITCKVPTSQLSVTGAETYTWSPVEGLSTTTGANPVASVDKSKVFTVVGTDKVGCTASKTITVNVSVDQASSFLVPNAFSPNGDNVNDCFGLKHLGKLDVKQFSIYNRWGMVVFQSTDPNACWDGKYKGIPQDAGNYVYVIRTTSFCGDVMKKGGFLLIR